MDDGDDLEWLKCTLVEKIVLQSPPIENEPYCRWQNVGE